jgi:hypothetical protein
MFSAMPIGKSVPATELPAGGSLPVACYGQDQQQLTGL